MKQAVTNITEFGCMKSPVPTMCVRVDREPHTEREREREREREGVGSQRDYK